MFKHRPLELLHWGGGVGGGRGVGGGQQKAVDPEAYTTPESISSSTTKTPKRPPKTLRCQRVLGFRGLGSSPYTNRP